MFIFLPSKSCLLSGMDLPLRGRTLTSLLRRSSYAFIGGRGSKSCGETLCNALPKSSTLTWSATVSSMVSRPARLTMTRLETGGLLRIGIKLMMACSTTNSDVYVLLSLLDSFNSSGSFRDYTALISLFGVYFQIRDDLMNLQSPEYTSNKGFAEDLTEGKFSFPVVHGIHADRSNRQVLSTLGLSSSFLNKGYSERLQMFFKSDLRLRPSRDIPSTT